MAVSKSEGAAQIFAFWNELGISLQLFELLQIALLLVRMEVEEEECASILIRVKLILVFQGPVGKIHRPAFLQHLQVAEEILEPHVLVRIRQVEQLGPPILKLVNLRVGHAPIQARLKSQTAQARVSEFVRLGLLLATKAVEEARTRQRYLLE